MNSAAKSSRREFIARDEFTKLLNGKSDIRNFEILEDVEINIEEKFALKFNNCKFNRISITCDLPYLEFYDCEFQQLNLSGKIEKVNVDGIDSSSASINIENANIEDLRLMFLGIDKIVIGLETIVTVDKLICSYSTINESFIRTNSDDIFFGVDNKITTLFCRGNQRQISLSFTDLINVVYSKYEFISISSNNDNCVLNFNRISAFHIDLYDCMFIREINVIDVTCERLMANNCNIGISGHFKIEKGNKINELAFITSNIESLNIFDSDLSESHFILHKSILNRINWQFVRWPKDYNFFYSMDIDESYIIETLRLLKVNAVRQQDKFNANLFSSLENEAYRIVLSTNKKAFGDKLILWLNHISNNHGLNPWKGVAFTIIVGAIFFFPSLFLLNNSYWNWGWTGWADYWAVIGKTTELFTKALYAAHSFDYLKEFQPKGIVFVLDFIGRIFVAFGYYQTIMAFRKFNRK